MIYPKYLFNPTGSIARRYPHTTLQAYGKLVRAQVGPGLGLGWAWVGPGSGMGGSQLPPGYKANTKENHMVLDILQSRPFWRKSEAAGLFESGSAELAKG